MLHIVVQYKKHLSSSNPVAYLRVRPPIRFHCNISRSLDFLARKKALLLLDLLRKSFSTSQ